MSFFKITFEKSTKRRNIFVYHVRGSQRIYSEIEDIAPDATHTNGIPLTLKLDGWADDQACPGDTFDTEEGFTVECITEDQFRKDTCQQDIPTYLLENVHA